MSINKNKFPIIISVVLIFFSILYYSCFRYQLGSYVKAEWWIKNLYEYKDYIAEELKTPKIIIISGSNALFGVNSNYVEDITGYPVVNLAGHAGLDISFFYLKLKEHMKQGDIVVMPLEFQHYRRNKYTGWFVNNMLAWGKEDYLSKLDIVSLLKFIISVPKERIYNGMLRQNGTNPIVDKDDVVTNMSNLFLTEGSKWRGYSYTSLNKYGDMVSGEKATESFLKGQKKGLEDSVPKDTSDRLVVFYKKIEKLVERNNGKLILTWPVTIRNKSFDLSLSKYQNQVDELRRSLRQKSIKIECNAALFNMDLKFFFNTQYHLNKYGSIIRSENLAHCINQVLEGKGQQNISYDKALNIVKDQEKIFGGNKSTVN